MAVNLAPVIDLDRLRAGWRAALGAADRALDATAGYLTPEDWHARRRRLEEEFAPTTELLQALARDEAFPPELAQPFVPRGLARRLLHLPPSVTSCVFNLEGVLVGSVALHVAAWQRTFDEFLAGRVESTHRRFVAPFDPQSDYPALHGHPRLEGVRTFLASRGIRLPEGEPSDAPGTETVSGLANRKSQLLDLLLEGRGVTAFEGSRHYLELAHDAGVRCAVISASAHTEAILERAGLAHLVDERVDADTIVAEHLRGRPAPDRLLAACRKLGVEPAHAAAFETSTSGVAAARAAGFRVVVAVERTEDAAHLHALRVEGADVVVPALSELLENHHRPLAA
jgi:beta-phosphoglucomutase-like phosphatase (HAD superfamily)